MKVASAEVSEWLVKPAAPTVNISLSRRAAAFSPDPWRRRWARRIMAGRRTDELTRRRTGLGPITPRGYPSQASSRRPRIWRGSADSRPSPQLTVLPRAYLPETTRIMPAGETRESGKKRRAAHPPDHANYMCLWGTVPKQENVLKIKTDRKNQEERLHNSVHFLLIDILYTYILADL